jgi:putative aldouronate transport system permease protein
MLKQSRLEKIFDGVNVVFLIGLSLAFVVPFIIVLSTSFVSPEEYGRRGTFVLWPEQFYFGAYDALIVRSRMLLNAFLVSLFRVSIGTGCNLLVTGTLAYVLARRSLPGRTFLTLVVFLTMLFGGGLIPTYMLVDSLRLTNSLWVLVIPSLVNAYWMLLLRNFFMSIPEEIEEAAIMDGASPFLIFWRVVIPLSLPAIATIGLFYAVEHWNAWFDATIYMTDAAKYPLQVILRGMLAITSSEALGFADNPPPAESLKSAMIIVTTAPIIMVYPFVQRYFVKGIMVGSVKG